MNTILLIEDNTEVRENTAEILELANYRVITAENGKVGVEKALQETPDLIICDIMMPVLDGYGVLHLLNKNEHLRNIPFIFLTAKAERTDFRKGMEMGADDYITKPFTDIELLNSIDRRLKKAALLKKEYAQGVEGMQAFLKDIGREDALKALSEGRNINHYKKKQLIYSEGNHPGRLMVQSAYPHVRRDLHRILKHYPADLLVSVRPLSIDPFLHALGKQHPPFITVVTDLVSTRSLWYHKDVDLCIVPTEAARQIAHILANQVGIQN